MTDGQGFAECGICGHAHSAGGVFDPSFCAQCDYELETGRNDIDPTHAFEGVVIECDQCGDDVTEGIPHKCPVGGNTVLIERKAGRAMVTLNLNEHERNVVLDALALAAEAWDEQADIEVAQTLHDTLTNA